MRSRTRLQRDGRREQPDADDHHQIDVVVHAQPRGVDTRHAMASATLVIGGFLGGCSRPAVTMLGNIGAVKTDFHAQESDPWPTSKRSFEQAVADSKKLPEKPDNATLLKIYALYKQATAGDVEGKRPGFTDMVGRAKWDAWNELKGKSADEAMQTYIDLIESLK
jgi:diazepam-binding inhibitor (GABA receptor modulating acyl-CoA-binding protein)